jgi:hypothetical protein
MPSGETQQALLGSPQQGARPSAVNPGKRLAWGFSPSAFAALALVAMLAARGVAPALPGTATGIAKLITAAGSFAGSATILVAVGGVVLCVHLLITVSTLPSLGVAFRFAITPAVLGVIALVFAAAFFGRPLEPDLGKLLAIAAIVALSATSPFLLGLRWARGPGLVLVASSIAGVLALLACELGRRAGAEDRAQALFALLATSASIAFELLAAVLAIVWVTRTRRRTVTTLAVTFAVALLVMSLAHAGEKHTAGAVLVLLHRSLEALSQQPQSTLPQELGEAASLVQLLLAGALLVLPGRRADVRAALSLCLVGGMTAGAPIAALLSVAGALLLAAAACDPHATREHLAPKVSD